MPSTSGAEDAAPFTVEELLAGMIATTGLDADTVTRWIESMWTPDAIQMRAGVLGGAMDPATGYFRTRAWRAAEFPAANMVADAHPLARMYAATVSDVDGLRLLDPSTVKTMTAVQTDKTPTDARPCTTTAPARTSTGTRTTSWRRTWHPQLDTQSTAVPTSGPMFSLQCSLARAAGADEADLSCTVIADQLANAPAIAEVPVARPERRSADACSGDTLPEFLITKSSLQAPAPHNAEKPRPLAWAFSSDSSPAWTRTKNPPVNSRMLCQLSYRGMWLTSGAGLSDRQEEL